MQKKFGNRYQVNYYCYSYVKLIQLNRGNESHGL